MEKLQESSDQVPKKPLLGRPGKLLEELEGKADITQLSEQLDEA